MEMIELIIAVIVCVLSIILFFKVWAMTNDVREIKSSLCGTKQKYADLELEVLRLKMLGRKEDAEKILNSEMEHSLRYICTTSKSMEDGEKRWKKKIEKMYNLYRSIGAEMPEEYRKFDIVALFETWNEI